VANQFTQQQVEAMLRPYGFQGQATGGAAQAFMQANPQAAAAFQAVSQGAAPQQVATPTTGAMPVGIEPLHQFERGALSQLGGYQAPQIMQQATQQVGNLMQGGLAQQLGQPMTQESFEAGIARYTNPYQQQVTQQAVSDVERRAEEMRNKINTRYPGARSFGSSSQGVQLASLAGDELEAIGRTQGEYGARGFEGAVSNMFNEMGQGRANLGTLGGLATTGSNLGTMQQAGEMGALQSQMGAGQTIRGYNQGVSDLAMQNYMGAQNFPMSNLTQLGTLAGVVPRESYNYQQMPTSQQQFGGALSALGGYVQPRVM
jgi:hypothetical protein